MAANGTNGQTCLKQLEEQWTKQRTNFLEKAKTMSKDQRNAEEAILRVEIIKLQDEVKSTFLV